MRIISAIFLGLILVFSVFSQQTKLPATNFTATTIDGEEFSLQDLRGYVVIITFWSTKCPICVSEIPNLNELAQKYKDKDVVFLAISMENKAKLDSFLVKKPFDFVVVPDGFGVLYQYGDKDSKGNLNMGYPGHFLLNQKGEIELKTGGWEKTALLESNIERLLSPTVTIAAAKPR